MKERTKKKMSLKSRKDKGFGKVVEDEAAMMREVDTYRDDLGKYHYACLYCDYMQSFESEMIVMNFLFFQRVVEGTTGRVKIHSIEQKST